MKKIAIALLGVTMLVGVSTFAHAESFDAQVPLTVTIPAQFGFTLDKYSHDFGVVNTGEGGETTIGIFCRSNHGIPWHLGIQGDPFTNTAGSTIANDPNFTMAAWTYADDPAQEAQGDFIYDGPIPSDMMYDFYDSTVEEGGDPFVPITMGLYLTVPSAADSGIYTTDVVLTMHE